VRVKRRKTCATSAKKKNNSNERVWPEIEVKGQRKGRLSSRIKNPREPKKKPNAS